jgi:hypothetical protein
MQRVRPVTVVTLALPALWALALYLRTLVPGIYVSDFAEFQYQPLRLGLPHPNGFPFYMLLGWLWSHLPVGTVAWRMNALSALGGALAVAITTGFAFRIGRRIPVALLAGGLLAVSPTFWYYSLAAERYTLNILLLASCWWAAWEAVQSKEARFAYLSALLLSLGLATHPSDALALPFWLAYLVLRLPHVRRVPRFWLVLLATGVAPLLLYLYVPWRWAAFGDWPLLPGVGRSSAVYHGMVHVWYEAPLRWDLLSRYIMGLSNYATGLLAGGWQQALNLMGQVVPYWLRDVPWIVLGLAGLGVIALFRRDALLVVVWGGFSAFLVLMVSYITQGKNDAYLLPAFWVVFLCAAFALSLLMDSMVWVRARLTRGRAGEGTPGWITGGAGVLAACAVLGLSCQGYPAADLSRAIESPRSWEVNLKHPLEEGAGLLGHWSDLTPLWYMQQIKGQRPDLVGLFPPDMVAVIEPWLRAGRALYLVAPLREWALDLPGRYDLMSWGRMVRILPKGVAVACPPQAHAIETPAAWPLAVTSWSVEDPLRSEVPGVLSFCWQAQTALPRDTFLRLRLRSLDTGDELVFNEPLISSWYPQSEVTAGRPGLALVPIQLPLGTPSGRYHLDIVPYRLRDDKVENWPDTQPVDLGEATVVPSERFQRSLLTDEVAPILAPSAGPMVLRAWRLSQPSVRPGDPIRLELLWDVRSPTAAAITVSLGFRDVTNGRLADPAHLASWSIPGGVLKPGTLWRGDYRLVTPLGRGDRTYAVEPRVQVGGVWRAWRPTYRLIVGTVRVHDREHVDGLPHTAVPIQARFGPVADLSGYNPLPESLRPGQPYPVTLYWRTRGETGQSYVVFVHLLDENGRLIAQHDSVPGEGVLPTSIWVPSEIIRDTHAVALPAHVPVGRYTLRVGLYDPVSGERLPVLSDLPVVDRSVEIAVVWMKP